VTPHTHHEHGDHGRAYGAAGPGGHGHAHGHAHGAARTGGHGHAHGHRHHGGHAHVPSGDADRRWLASALAVIVGFMVVEVVAGIVASSLALLSDAAHMLTDAGAIGLALVAARLAARPARGAFTFGLGRAEILSAQINGAALLVLAGLIALEAVQRIADPPEVEGGIVIVVGAIGGLANVGAAWALSRAERQSLNVAGAMAHVLADLYGSLAAVASGALILATGVGELDGIAALTVAALMVVSGWRLVRDASRVLLEASPAGIDPDEIGRALASQAGVVEVHDLHVWEVTTGFPAVAAHVVVAPNDDCHAVRRRLQHLLSTTFGIRHTTLQVDHPIAHQGLLTIEDARARDRPE
jgi:cobalt-zinc-cadmium efflux system protein